MLPLPHVRAPLGTGRQTPARQKLPVVHCALVPQVATQRLSTQVLPALHWAVLEQVAFGVQRPELHEQRESQSLLFEHSLPGHPKVQSAKASSYSMMVQPLVTSIGRVSSNRPRSRWAVMAFFPGQWRANRRIHELGCRLRAS